MQLGHASVQGAIDRVAAACAKHGKWWGMPTGTPAAAQAVLDRGGRFITCGGDHGFLVNGYRNAVGEFAYRVANKLAALVGPRPRLRATTWSIAVGVRRRKSPPAVFVCGDGWYAIGPAARRRMVELAARPDIDDLFRTTLIPDESHVHTLAVMDGWKVLDSRVMHTVWPYEGSPHPRELGPADLEMLEGSEAPFARKVTGADGAELARLLDAAYEGSSAGA